MVDLVRETPWNSRKGQEGQSTHKAGALSRKTLRASASLKNTTVNISKDGRFFLTHKIHNSPSKKLDPPLGPSIINQPAPPS
jgi:hypothetical protein